VAYSRLLDDGRVRCEVCPRSCTLAAGERGGCRLRRREGDAIVCDTHGRGSGLAVDPIEKKPLYHVLPGTRILSFGTAGCNLACRFCQNWHLSHADGPQAADRPAAPAEIAAEAARRGCPAVAFTYNDPVVFLEYALDTAAACHARRIRTVAVTAGYVHGQARTDLFAAMDAANVDLKGFTERFYHRWCGGRLAPVLDTLRHIRHATTCFLEVTTLVIPGLNDGVDDLRALARWLVGEIGPDVPWHLSAFHPAGEVRDRPPTPPATLRRARDLALEAGLRFVYTGNIQDPAGGVTTCPGCDRTLIERDGFAVTRQEVTVAGTCPGCGIAIPGIWDAGGGVS
jgi:pyruvate formate lyase activating enzyme